MTDHCVAIRVEGLTKTLGRRVVLKDLDVEIPEGECLALMGDNGAGKTTLLRCLAGLVRPDAGDVRWFGLGAEQAAMRSFIGLVAHESLLYPYLTLRENLVLAGRLHAVSEPARRAMLWLGSAGLDGHADRLPGEVSRGMRRRASIARALINDPPILLLDEPFSGLDRTGCDWTADLLRTRRLRGWTTCLVTHEDRTARHLADRTLVLRSGRLGALSGPPRHRPVMTSVLGSSPPHEEVGT